jgi:hypothetical protein
MDSTGARLPLMRALLQRKRHLCGGRVKNAADAKKMAHLAQNVSTFA